LVDDVTIKASVGAIEVTSTSLRVAMVRIEASGDASTVANAIRAAFAPVTVTPVAELPAPKRKRGRK
jgi:hypothetical protein